MAGVVLETLSNKKLSILSISLVLILIAFFLIGGLIAPSPNTAMHSIAVKCLDIENTWHLGETKLFLPRDVDDPAVSTSKSCEHVNSFQNEIIEKKAIDVNQIVLSQMLPLPRENTTLDFSRWFQTLITVLDFSIVYNKTNPFPENTKPPVLIEANLFARDKGEDWTLVASSKVHRALECTIENSRREDGLHYHCELLPLFELGSCHYDYYLINMRLPVRRNSNETTYNHIGQLEDLNIIYIFQNGGFSRVWFSMKTVMFPVVCAVLVWFWKRVIEQGRSTNLTERTLFSLGVILSIMNCPIEWFTLVVNMPFMMLLNDIRDGAFYAMLLSFWLIFAGEHMMDQMERNKLSAYTKHLAVIILASLALLVFELAERGRQLVDPFYSIWSSDVGAVFAFGFIIVAGIAACLYFMFLCYQIFLVFRNISTKRNTLLQMSTLRRKYYSGLIFRFKFLMIITLLCAALTVIFFIISQVSEGQWKWGDESPSLEYVSAFMTGVYGMWNVYVIALLCLYAPSHKKFTTDYDENTDTNSREEEVQLTQMPSTTSEGSGLAAFITKAAAD